MLRNYLRITLNNIRKNKLTATINLTGLALGIACCTLITLYISRELSYDNYHNDLDQLYRVGIHNDPADATKGQVSVSYGVAEALLTEYTGVMEAARMVRLFNMDPSLRNGELAFTEQDLVFADQAIFNILTVSFLHGDINTALVEPNSLVLSQDMAIKYFGEESVVGRTLTVNLNNTNSEYRITGVIANAPENTHFRYSAFASLESVFLTLRERTINNFQSWFNYQFWTYMKLEPGVDPAQFEASLQQIADKYFPPTRKAVKFFIQPVKDIRLHSNYRNELQPNNDITYIYIFAVTAVLVMLVASINFMNMATARSLKRAREVGMRKVLGARRPELIIQFLTESLLMTFIGIVIAVGLIYVLSALVPDLHFIAPGLQQLGVLNSVLFLFGVTFIIGVLSGIYPAFFLSSYQPSQTLKGEFSKSKKGRVLRSVLVTAQMAITVILLVAILAISKQLSYIQGKKLGFSKEQVLVVKVAGSPLGNLALPQQHVYETFKERALLIPGVEAITRHNRIVGEGAQLRSIGFAGTDDEEREAVDFMFVSHDFLDTYQLQLKEGRGFERTMDTTTAYIVNEAAVKAYNLEPALGRVITSGDRRTVPGPIIGIVEDFHYAPLHDNIRPLILGLFNFAMPNMAIRLNTNNLQETVAQIDKAWTDLAPNRPMEYRFLDERLQAVYQFESQLGRIVTYFTGLAIFIACLGLFGMSVFAAEQRTKEFAVRKVLGASTRNIILTFSSDFVKLLIIANVVAWPVAYYAVQRWLNTFSYKTEVGLGVFLLAGVAALLLALLTISYQSVSAAIKSPAETIGRE